MYPSVEAIKEFLAKDDSKPFICCEYTHAMGNSCGAMHKYTDLTDTEPNIRVDLSGITLTSLFIRKTAMEKSSRHMAAISENVLQTTISVVTESHMAVTENHLRRCRK